MSYQVTITSDAEAFAAVTARFLGAELEREQLARILDGVLKGRYGEQRNHFATVLDAHSELVAAALRTPPHSLNCTRLPDPASLAIELIDRWLARDPDIVGVGAEPETARAIAAAWARRTGGETELHLRMAMHAASAIEDPPRPVAGRLRLGAAADQGLLVRWWRGFYAEAEPLHPDDAEQAVAERYANRALHVWEDGGEVVSLIGARLTGSGYGWIGPVYTPPELRRRGYAGAGVAAASRRLLDAGASRCMLFTDLDNPTSNKIYHEVGYRRFADWDDHRFEAPR
ncbi:MAG: GNAT family N-acetyltransferase [Solirubrobacteraceae bacterium]